jgi:hypothetical protein
MRTKSIFYFLAALVLIVVFWIFYDTFRQPGVADMAGTYKEIGKYRNENNTGPIVRIYAVYTPDTLWEEMKTYGEYMPHTKYGNTKVFFFNQEHPEMSIAPEYPHFDQALEASCVARYEKTAMGESSLVRYPFK